MDRLWIRGTSGSGKTTLGKALGARLSIEPPDLDDLFWLPGWKERSGDDFLDGVQNVVAGPRWILSGHYVKRLSQFESHADTIVWLDYSLGVTLWRILCRTVRRCVWGESCCNGNRESFFKSFFTRESIIWWCVTTHARRHRECLAFMAESRPAGQTRVHHRSPGETARWLSAISAEINV